MVLTPGARDVVRRRDSARLPVVGVLLAGVAVGLLWPAVLPWSQGIGGPDEVMAAGDATLGVLCVVAGLGTTLLVVLRPGPTPALRLSVLLGASVAGAGVAWGVGLLAGAPPVHAVGVLLLWPLTLAMVSLVRSVIGLLIHGD